MSTYKISTMPVETFLYENTRARVALWEVGQIPGHHRPARQVANRDLGRGDESDNEKIFVWSAQDKAGRARLNYSLQGRPRRQIRENAGDWPRVRPVDIFKLRDEFFDVTDAKEGLRFFTEFGIFGEEHRERFARFNVGLSVRDLLKWQELLRECRLTEARHWETITRRYSYLRAVGDILQIPEFSIDLVPYPYLRLQCDCVRDAIMAANYLEKLANVKSSMCQRKGCGKVFNHETRHKRKFCDPDCAHHDAVKRSRARKAGK
jgi:hypothetical protein